MINATPPPDSSAEPVIRNERLIKGVLATTIAASAFTIQIFLPALPAVQAAFDVTATQVQLTISLPLLVTALATLIYGPLSDRYGRRPILIIGMVLFFVGTVLCLFAPTILTLVLGRFIQALGSAAGVVIARAAVRDLYGRERAAAVLAGLVAVMIVAPMIAPTLGGFLVDAFGWRGNIGATVLFAGALLALVVFGFPETHHARSGASFGLGSMVESFQTLLASPAYRAYAFQSAFMIAIFYVFLAAAPYAVMVVMDVSATGYGLYFLLSTVGYLGGTLLANRYSQRVGIDRMVRIGTGLAVLTTAIVVILMFAGIWHPLAVFIPITVMGVANGMALPNASAGAISVYPDLAGAASGLTSFIQLGISAVFAQVSGSLQNGTPHPLALYMFGAAILAWVSFEIFKRAEAAETLHS
ncbi:MAG: multidrug effflux MFS transporter [Rhodospirillaceae bacterium]|jgi:MFS transporter, DHA1 family, multidrug resistance protein|nr:multidrug effflux MFS transporter [Rhodospirillaceae bacterium]MBT5564094.1 multidrug effflux MFS transporter [Rhodospirillaceae bacterium]MBT6089891.1 multidrug effflux MFS transporter [Rhodospirillaceae bacterium]